MHILSCQNVTLVLCDCNGTFATGQWTVCKSTAFTQYLQISTRAKRWRLQMCGRRWLNEWERCGKRQREVFSEMYLYLLLNACWTLYVPLSLLLLSLQRQKSFLCWDFFFIQLGGELIARRSCQRDFETAKQTQWTIIAAESENVPKNFCYYFGCDEMLSSQHWPHTRRLNRTRWIFFFVIL